MTAQPMPPGDVPDVLINAAWMITMEHNPGGTREELARFLADFLRISDAIAEQRARAAVAAEIEAAAPAVTVMTGPAATFRAQGMHQAARIARGEDR